MALEVEDMAKEISSRQGGQLHGEALVAPGAAAFGCSGGPPEAKWSWSARGT
jgi:hypothetical protein